MENQFPMMSRAWALFEMLVVEGGAEFTDDASDSGGATRWGVTEDAARAYGYEGEMSELPMETALDIGGKAFWDRMKCDDLATVSPSLAWIVYSAGYHAGQKTPIKWLQEFLNVTNNLGTLWQDQTVDGLNGPTTIRTLKAYVDKRGNQGLRNLLDYMMGCQTTYYKDLVVRREKDEKWFYGWLNRNYHLRNDVMEFRADLYKVN